MGRTLARRFCPEWPDPAAVQAAYERHNADVGAAVAPERLIEWRPADGWQPLCAALGVPVPEEPFPRTNDAAGFRHPREARRRGLIPAHGGSGVATVNPLLRPRTPPAGGPP